MTSPPLSKAQQRAVEHPFADALVTAGAGSGKTRVLSERFVHLVRGDSAPLRRLAALTFTEKAAAQMRARIAALFRELADGLDGDAAREADAQRAEVEFAPISTIHAFCALLLRQHTVEAGVDPAFQVLDADESDLLKDDAALQAENLLAEQHPDLVELYPMLSSADPRAELLGLLDRLRGAGVDPREIEWRVAGTDLLAALAAVEEPLELFAGVADHLEEARQPNHADAVLLVRRTLAKVRDDDEVSPFYAAQAHARVDDLKGPRKHAYSKPRAALSRALGALTAALLDAWGPREFLPRLRAILGTYDDAYKALKAERSALDFTDLELRARDLLRRAAERKRPLDLAPRGLLVDEFQDTNPLQAEILALLRSQAPQFSVGDPKQSIYRFRRADVDVILRERERVGAAAVHPMNASYRTCEPLVKGINALNGALFAGDAAGVTYEPLEAAAPFLPADGPVLEFAVVDAGDEVKIAGARPCEAAWIARRIRELVEGPTPRLKPRRDAAGRPTDESVGDITYGDIAVLFRAAGDLPLYEAALEAEGVPFLTQKSKGYFQAQEISDLIHVLRTVHNPEDRFALACTATGPALAATDDELLRWFREPTAEESETLPASAWRRMVAEADRGGRHAPTVRVLQKLRVEAVGGSLASTVERVLLELGLYESALLEAGGDRRAANLRKAVDLARRLDRGGRRGLADLLRHLATLRSREIGESEAPIGGESDEVVRLTTIHSAKGLEYPVVFLADVGRKTPNDTRAFRHDGGLQIAARVKDPLEGTGCKPAGFGEMATRDTLEEAQEALRVLYVAMTRAEERLIISTACTGSTQAGLPKTVSGWGKRLWEEIGAPFEHGEQTCELGDARLRVHVVDAATLEAPAGPETLMTAEAVTPELQAEAGAVLAAAGAGIAVLGDTRYVVSVSELLTFAESPQRYYRERVVYGGARAAASAAWDLPPEGLDGEAATPEDTGARSERVAQWDEPAEQHTGLDRAAVGRAVHAVIEHLGGGAEPLPAWALERAVEAEGGDAAFTQAVQEMTERYLACPTGTRMRAALLAGEDVRREVALHARIRFPGGEPVGGFDSLLVKGSIDLWLPAEGGGGVWIVDHKTNRAGGRFRRPEDLGEHYAWQLRLYALAVERVLGQDVAGARLVLLDPGWGPEALEVDVDVSGPQLEEARRLCRAFAIAELEGRYPADWTSLLS